MLDVVDAVDASDMSQGPVEHHSRRVRQVRRVVRGFLVLFGSKQKVVSLVSQNPDDEPARLPGGYPELKAPMIEV